MTALGNIVGKIYPGTAISMGFAVVVAVLMTVLELYNKQIPTVFPIVLTASAGGGVAIAASGGSSVPASNESTSKSN